MTRQLNGLDLLQGAYRIEEFLSGFLAGFGFSLSPVSVSGFVADPGVYNLPYLTPIASQAATYTAAGVLVSDNYTGISLWNLLNGEAGGVAVTSAKNDILSKYVVATGVDGYKAVFSLGEIDPKFGDQPVLVAYRDQAGQLGPQGGDGLARMVVPGDHAGGRYVSELVDLHVGSLPEPRPAGLGGISDHFGLSGDVANPTAFSAASLAGLGVSTNVTATYLAGSTRVTDDYTGVSLWTLIKDAGVLTDPAIKNDILRFGVIATGSDGYRALISLGEIDPAFGNQPDLVAYADENHQLGAGGTAGAMRLVVPNDQAGGRYVSNLIDLRVVDLAG